MIYIDIETLPAQNAVRKQEIIDSVEVKCPHTTKGATAKDLGMTDADVKFISAGDLKQKWVDEVGVHLKEQLGVEAWKKTALNGEQGEICSISFAVNDGEISHITRGLDVESEIELLEVFWSMLENSLRGRADDFCAHNKAFDLPFIYHRSVITRVKPPFKFNPYARNHVCTMELWSGFKGMIGLDRLAGILGLSGKSGDGCQVFDWFDAGEVQKIADYNDDDVRLLRDIHQRLTFKVANENIN